MEITADLVKKLREMTGLSVMDCKKALTETTGDVDKAVDILRQKGALQAAKRADNATSEGRIACHVGAAGGRGAIVELRCESAPVATTDQFIALADLLAKAAAAQDNPTAESIVATTVDGRSVQDAMNEVFNLLRENMKVARVATLNGVLGHYVHHNGQGGVLVQFNMDCPAEVRADVSMHIFAMNPLCLKRDEVNPEWVAAAKAKAQEEVQGKPPQITEQIVNGKLDRWFSERVLLEQPFVKEDKFSVQEYLNDAVKGLTVTKYYRYQVGVE
jgi:elongation factor Ts